MNTGLHELVFLSGNSIDNLHSGLRFLIQGIDPL